MPLVKKDTVNIPSNFGLPDIEIYFEEYSSPVGSVAPKPTILFLHGGPGVTDHNMYVPFWSQLEDVANVEFIDLRGHGKSSGHEPHFQKAGA